MLIMKGKTKRCLDTTYCVEVPSLMTRKSYVAPVALPTFLIPIPVSASALSSPHLSPNRLLPTSTGGSPSTNRSRINELGTHIREFAFTFVDGFLTSFFPCPLPLGEVNFHRQLPITNH